MHRQLHVSTRRTSIFLLAKRRVHFPSSLYCFRTLSKSKMVSIFTGGLQKWDTLDVQFAAPQPHTQSYSVVASDPEKKPVLTKTGTSCGKKFPKEAESIDVLSAEYGPAPLPSRLSLEERYKLCLSVAEECIQPEELLELLRRDSHPICYDGFEPSGRMHIAQGVMKAINVNKITEAGCVFVFWVADWFAMLNNKLGGDLEKIQRVGTYFIEVWKALGMRLENVRFLWASEQINKHPGTYWTRVMDIARHNNITRVKRCCQIMGRAEGDDQPASNIFYPCMQCADIFYLRASICQLGMDQRKVNMLAREYVDQKKLKHKPVILSHTMLPGLQEGQEKMSKSNPDSAIFMEDTPQEVNQKVKRAFCPPEVLEGNPCVAYVEHILFPWFHYFDVERKETNGGPITYTSVASFKDAYRTGALHPGDLKPNLARKLNEILQPVREHFQVNPDAKELLATIRNYQKNKK